MQLPEPFGVLGEHFTVVLPGARAAFTTRRGGHSRGPYASLNLGRLTGDDPAAVQLNRTRLEAEIGGRLSFVRQVHGSRVCETTSVSAQPGAGALERLESADGQVTRSRGIALAALTADCLPIAIAGRGAAAMLHAGWRGLQAGVIAAGVRRLGSERGPLAAAIGPGAGPCCYEVGHEVHAAFDGLPARVHRGRKLDLKAIARHQLLAVGVADVHDIAICTICSDPSLLFSHRRDHGVTGRQAGLAWLS